MHAIDAHCPAFSREAVLLQLLDAGAAVDVWGHDLRGPLDLMVGEQHERRALPHQSELSYPLPPANICATPHHQLLPDPTPSHSAPTRNPTPGGQATAAARCRDKPGQPHRRKQDHNAHASKE